MDLRKGTVVISRAGRDKGKPLAVVGLEDKFVLVADGKERTLARPKKKNPIHLSVTKKTVQVEGVSDKALRRSLIGAENDGEQADESGQPQTLCTGV